MATYTLNTNAYQETVLDWACRQRTKDGVTPTHQSTLFSWLADNFSYWESEYGKRLAVVTADEVAKALATDTKSAIEARVAARMLE